MQLGGYNRELPENPVSKELVRPVSISNNLPSTDRWLRVLAAALFLMASLALASEAQVAQPAAYDPLTTPALEFEEFELAVDDAERGRRIPLCVHLPAGTSNLPTVLFSHGLGGSCQGNDYLARHWAARGYAAIFVQHPGSDDGVWKGKSGLQRMRALKNAANAENFMARAKDIPAVLDQLTDWNALAGHRLEGRLDLSKIGMAGHSFGAMTTQSVSGMKLRGGRVDLREPRIDAALALSPNAPRRVDPSQAFGSVEIPWMLMTGTRDVVPIGDADVESRLAVFKALPPGEKYELVLHDAEHSAFSDRELTSRDGERNANHHRAIQALSTAFWDAHLQGDPAALAWLEGNGPARILEGKDRWQRK